MLAAAPGEAANVDLPLVGRHLKPETIEAIARDANIPVLPLARVADPSVIERLRSWRPDAIAVACFPKLIPPAVCELAPLGALNVHPSLLPRHRGPDPLFWTFRRGDASTGVTIHELTDRYDAGPIVEQAAIEIPFGIEGAALEARLADLGGVLLAKVIARRAAGDFESRPQDETNASVEPFPSDDALLIRSNESGRIAYAFVRGIASLGYAATVAIAESGARISVASAHSYAPGARQGVDVVRKNNRVAVQFPDGICEFSVNDLRKTITLGVDSATSPVR